HIHNTFLLNSRTNCFDDFIRLVVPELQTRGVYKTHYQEGSIRRKLFGSDRLPASHPARWDSP
ncbi:MAG: N5,N10-methylene tetrahydromethanopterin reductase, partial [Betaproteobacteria bacterium]|nr:N5,N10-methylene tetrahydromethanopterin reductase [Betaproteobacteria bacterium]